MCERRYLVGEQWYNLKRNALAEYRVGLQQVSFWLDWDRGAMNVRGLAVTFTSYAHYIARLFHSKRQTRLSTSHLLLKQFDDGFT